MRKSSLCCSNISITAANWVPSRKIYIWLGCSRPRPVPNNRTRNSATQALAWKEIFKGHWTASFIFLSMSSTKATMAGVCATGRLSSTFQNFGPVSHTIPQVAVGAEGVVNGISSTTRYLKDARWRRVVVSTNIWRLNELKKYRESHYVLIYRARELSVDLPAQELFLYLGKWSAIFQNERSSNPYLFISSLTLSVPCLQFDELYAGHEHWCCSYKTRKQLSS